MAISLRKFQVTDLKVDNTFVDIRQLTGCSGKPAWPIALVSLSTPAQYTPHRCRLDPIRKSWWNTWTRSQPMSSSSSLPSRTQQWARRRPSPRWTTSSRRPKISWTLYQRWWRPALSAPPRWVLPTQQPFAMQPNFSLSQGFRSSEVLPCIFSRHSLTLGGVAFLLSRVCSCNAI